MLSAEAYSFRQKSRLAISLSWIAGYTNIVALLSTGHVISHMSGNTTVFSSAVGDLQWGTVATYGAILTSFLLGAAGSSLMTEMARRRGLPAKYVMPMAVETILLGVLGLWLAQTPSPGLPFACIAALAMGLQNATITHISSAEIRTTHVTGVITDLGLEAVQFLLWWRDKLRYNKNPLRLGRTFRLSRRHPTLLRLLLLASILGSFGFGAIAGTMLLQHSARLVMVPPVLFLLWIIVSDWRQPIADVSELDLLGDSELKKSGIVQGLLPADLGIYRVSQHHARVRAPHFRAWAERIPRRWRIVILVLSPIAQLTDNAALDLLAAARRLREEGRIVIVANFTPRQFQTLRRCDGVNQLGKENIVPDLEFAIARALAMALDNGL